MPLEDAITELTLQVKMLRNIIMERFPKDGPNLETKAALAADAKAKGKKKAAEPEPEEDDSQAADADAANDPEAEEPAADEDAPAEEESADAEEPAADEDDAEDADFRAKLKVALQTLLKTKGREVAVKLLARYGAKDIGTVPKEKLERCLSECQTIIKKK